MKKTLFIWLFLCLSTLLSTGCGKFDPISPSLDQKVDNQNGEIEEMKSVQDGLSAEVGKLRQQSDVIAKDIGNYQQSLIAKSNSGIQILQGDGSLILVFALGTIGMILIYHYRTQAQTHEKTANILAAEIAKHDDPDLENKIYKSALKCGIGPHVYNTIQKVKN